jgi:phosphotransferase system IIA component
MTWKTIATVYAVAPFAGLWTAFFIFETAHAVALIRKTGGRRHG